MQTWPKKAVCGGKFKIQVNTTKSKHGEEKSILGASHFYLEDRRMLIIIYNKSGIIGVKSIINYIMIQNEANL